MKEHLLKTVDIYWDALESGEKTFEVRKNDRAFQKGDTLRLRRIGHDWITQKMAPSAKGRDVTEFDLLFTVTYVLQGGQFGIEPTYCVMGITPGARDSGGGE